MLHRRRALPSGRRHQRGQALLFVTVTALVMMLALLTLFSMGQLTTEKMKLQNTVDAAAYSAALAQARDYNFSAYLNRGMIANDVAVAQLVGLASWGQNLDDTFNTLTPRAEPGGRFGWINQGPLYPVWSATHGIAKSAALGIKSGFEFAATFGVPALHGLNTTFMAGQSIYHYGTAFTVAQTIGAETKFNSEVRDATGFDLSALGDYIGISSCANPNKPGKDCHDIVKANDPEAGLSLFGLLSYASHTKKWLQFTSVRNPLGPAGSETVQENNRDCPSDGWRIDPNYCWEKLGGLLTKVVYWPSSITKTKTHPTDKDDDGPNKDRMSGVVTGSLDEFTKDRSKDWNLPRLIDPTMIPGPSPNIPSAWFLKWLYHDGETKLADDKNSAGLRKTNSWNQRWAAGDSTHMLAIATVPIGYIPFWGFINLPIFPMQSGSNAATDWLGNDASGKAHAGPSNTGMGWLPLDTNSLKTSDSTALRTYRDVTDIKQATAIEHHSSQSPAILVEVEKKTKSLATSNLHGTTDAAGCNLSSKARNASKITAPLGTDNLNLKDGAAANCMRAMAKAEAYFLRPRDLFTRADGNIEYGSLYSPYWQARLVPVNGPEQAASLVMHGLSSIKDTTAGTLANVLKLFD